MTQRGNNNNNKLKLQSNCLTLQQANVTVWLRALIKCPKGFTGLFNHQKHLINKQTSEVTVVLAVRLPWFH